MTKAHLTPTSRQEIRRIFELQQQNHLAVGRTTAKERIQKLQRLKSVIQEHMDEIRAAIYQDFKKPEVEVDLTEIYPVIKEIKHVSSQLKRWMKPRRVGTPLAMIGSTSYVQYQPKGVVLIISPWNYPINLTLIPLVTAIAAGNCVILKPSENTPNSSRVMQKMVEAIFQEEEVAMVQGAVDTAQALLELPFNHIFFTGAPSIGKIVMKAAAKNLTSVTLELGGKSPTIVDQTADIQKAASRISWGKFTNTGQTCIAPDYILAHESIKDELVSAIQKSINDFYGSDAKSAEDYPRIVNEKHLERLTSYLEDAQSKGASILSGGSHDAEENYLAPTLLGDVSDDATISDEEIFGPILPIYTYKELSQAIDYVNSKEKPLALYIFSKNQQHIDRILRDTRAGGTSINQTVMHFTNNNLPFGGDNNSGIGKSHGWYGFEAFSNARSVLRQKWPISATDLATPPYNNFKRKLAAITLKWL
jgi:aldehyde dehydrogenase (NAD+)